MAFSDWKADLARAVSDAFGEPVTVTPRTPVGSSVATGARTYTLGTPVVVKAKREAVRPSVAGGGASARSNVSETEYVIAMADLGFTPDRHTLVTDNGIVQEACEPPAFEAGRALVRVRCRSVRATGA